MQSASQWKRIFGVETSVEIVVCDMTTSAHTVAHSISFCYCHFLTFYRAIFYSFIPRVPYMQNCRIAAAFSDVLPTFITSTTVIIFLFSIFPPSYNLPLKYSLWNLWVLVLKTVMKLGCWIEKERETLPYIHPTQFRSLDCCVAHVWR